MPVNIHGKSYKTVAERMSEMKKDTNNKYSDCATVNVCWLNLLTLTTFWADIAKSPPNNRCWCTLLTLSKCGAVIDTAPGVKLGGGTVTHAINEVEVSCFPADLPEYLELDVGELELDASLSLSDLKLPKGVELTDLINENDQSVVSIHIIKAAPIEEEQVEGEEGAEEAEGEEAPKADDEAPKEEGGDE